MSRDVAVRHGQLRRYKSELYPCYLVLRVNGTAPMCYVSVLVFSSLGESIHVDYTYRSIANDPDDVVLAEGPTS